MTHEHPATAPDPAPVEEVTEEPADAEDIPPIVSDWDPAVDDYRLTTR